MIATETEIEKQIWEEVGVEFPDDPMMQELHFHRRMRWEAVRHLPLEEASRRLLFGDEPNRLVAARA